MTAATGAMTPQVAFAEALAAFQADLPSIGKGSRAEVPTKNGGKYSYNYAALPDILDATLPALTEKGFAFTATPAVTEHGFVLKFALIHNAGHREEGSYPLPDPASSSPQQIGSAITYGRRYCFTAVTGIAPDEDDDGQAASDARAADSLPRAPRRANATTRRTAEDIGDPSQVTDEWTAPVTDPAWIAGFRTRLEACTAPAEVRGLDEEAHLMFAENRLSPDDAKALKTEIDNRTKELRGELVSP